MGRKASLQGTYSKGELDPDLSERVDLEHYYDSLAAAPNTLFHPQGGFSDRGGFSLVSDPDILAAGTVRRLRNRIVPVPVTPSMVSAFNGGTATMLVDQDPTTLFTTNAVTTALFSIAEIDLGVATTVDLVDVMQFRCELAFADNALLVQYWNGLAWVTFADPVDTAPAKHLRTSARTRRFGTAPGGPGGTRITARQWRIVAQNAAGTGQIFIGGLRFWAEVAALSPIDLRSLARDRATAYELVVTERNIDVFENQRYVASIAVPVAGAQIAQLSWAGGFDTLLLFHELLEPLRLMRQGASGEWDAAPAPFTNVPVLRQQIIFSGDQDEIQDVTFPGIAAGDRLFFWLGDAGAPLVTFTDAAALPALVAAAIVALPGVAPGAGLVVTAAPGPVPGVRVRFTGANGSRAWPLLSVISATPALVPVTTVVQAGLKSTGKLFEATTGWPRCGAFVQQRFVAAGFRAAPTSLMFCRPDAFDMLDTGSPMTADLAFLRTLNADGIETITSIFVGRHLQVFTEQSEWYAASQSFDATQPTALIRNSGHGIQRAVPLTFADGSTLFVQAGGKTVRDLLWDQNQANYGAEPLTVLSPQILSDIVDVAHRSARSVTDGNLIFFANRDGSAACITLLRGQNVIAGSPWATAGRFKCFMVNVRHDAYAVIERSGNHWLEKWTPDVPLDFATQVTLTAPVGANTSIVTGATHLEGRGDIWALCDGDPVGPLTCSGGSILLGVVATDVTYGLLPDWKARTQVLRAKITQEQPFRPPGRIYEVELSLKSTGQLMIAPNGRNPAPVPLLRAGDAFRDAGPLQTANTGAPGLPMMQRLMTGNVRVGGLIGFSRTPYMELFRTVPAPVTVKAMRFEMVMKAEQ